MPSWSPLIKSPKVHTMLLLLLVVVLLCLFLCRCQFLLWEKYKFGSGHAYLHTVFDCFKAYQSVGRYSHTQAFHSSGWHACARVFHFHLFESSFRSHVEGYCLGFAFQVVEVHQAVCTFPPSINSLLFSASIYILICFLPHHGLHRFMLPRRFQPPTCRVLHLTVFHV